MTFTKDDYLKGLDRPAPTSEELAESQRLWEEYQHLTPEKKRQRTIAELEASGHDVSHLKDPTLSYGAGLKSDRPEVDDEAP